jgi:hypothetical protein
VPGGGEQADPAAVDPAGTRALPPSTAAAGSGSLAAPVPAQRVVGAALLAFEKAAG